jgi:hypothetical protein
MIDTRRSVFNTTPRYLRVKTPPAVTVATDAATIVASAATAAAAAAALTQCT